MTPDDWRAWQRVFRDTVLVVVGAFMLIYETVWAPNPNAYLVGAGLAALGLAPVLRLDQIMGSGKTQ